MVVLMATVMLHMIAYVLILNCQLLDKQET